MIRVLLPVLLAGAAVAAPAGAGPAHVLTSQAPAAVPADATYAVSDTLDPHAREVLTQALRDAGLRTAAPGAPHTHLVTVQAEARALCTLACSSVTLQDEAALSDHYRHVATVAAQANPGDTFAAGAPVAWWTVLQSDGLSARRGDHLPALLRYGARAYGRTTPSERAPRLSSPLTMLSEPPPRPGA